MGGVLPSASKNPTTSEVDESELVLHDEGDATWANILARFGHGLNDVPTPLGVLLKQDKSCYDDGVIEQIEEAREKKGRGDLKKLLQSGDTWTIE